MRHNAPRVWLFSWIFVLLSLVSGAVAQDGVPTEIMQRTLRIKWRDGVGTAFRVDFKNKVYLITARHVVPGVPAENAVIEIWQDNQWKDYKTVRTIYPFSNDVDIAVFETTETLEKPYWVAVGGQPTFGQQVWFLGFPYGLATHGNWIDSGGEVSFPFIKRGTMSAIDTTNKNAIVLYIDGFNNPGFSGGPILFWDFSTRSYRIIGVVQGYREDSAKVLVNGQHVDTQLLVNTGILTGYEITHAMKAIEDRQKPATAK